MQFCAWSGVSRSDLWTISPNPHLKRSASRSQGCTLIFGSVVCKLGIICRRHAKHRVLHCFPRSTRASRHVAFAQLQPKRSRARCTVSSSLESNESNSIWWAFTPGKRSAAFCCCIVRSISVANDGSRCRFRAEKTRALDCSRPRAVLLAHHLQLCPPIVLVMQQSPVPRVHGCFPTAVEATSPDWTRRVTTEERPTVRVPVSLSYQRQVLLLFQRTLLLLVRTNKRRMPCVQKNKDNQINLQKENWTPKKKTPR